jgi:hypothetical protein
MPACRMPAFASFARLWLLGKDSCRDQMGPLRALACSTWANPMVTKRWSRFRGHPRYCGLVVSRPPAAATCAIGPNRLCAKSAARTFGTGDGRVRISCLDQQRPAGGPTLLTIVWRVEAGSDGAGARKRRERTRELGNYLRAGALNCTRTPSGPVTKTEFPDFSAFVPGATRSIAARAASGEKFSTAIAKWSIGLIRPVPL